MLFCAYVCAADMLFVLQNSRASNNMTTTLKLCQLLKLEFRWHFISLGDTLFKLCSHLDEVTHLQFEFTLFTVTESELNVNNKNNFLEIGFSDLSFCGLI